MTVIQLDKYRKQSEKTLPDYSIWAALHEVKPLENTPDRFNTCFETQRGIPPDKM